MRALFGGGEWEAAAAAAAVASCSPEIFNARERDIFSAQTSWVCTQVAV